MSIIITKTTRAIVQGITGKEGLRAAKEMKAAGVTISGGVTPGKGDTDIDGFKVFESVHEAKQHDPAINASIIYVPPLAVYDAAIEAINNNITTIIIVTENVPIKDAAQLVEYAQKHDTLVIGPSTVGILAPGVGKLGSIGGHKEQTIFTPGPIGIISKSGGMCTETALNLTRNGLGQSTVVSIGGDIITGSTFTDILALFEKDQTTQAVVIYGELGGTYENAIADMVRKGQFTKPIIAYISGTFAETIKRQLSFGHAGAIIENNEGKTSTKKQLLKEAGILVAEKHHHIPELVKQSLHHGI